MNKFNSALICWCINVREGIQTVIGATIISGINIGKWCTIGAETVVINDIPDGATVVGNPGKIIKIDNNYDIINYEKIVTSH